MQSNGSLIGTRPSPLIAGAAAAAQAEAALGGIDEAQVLVDQGIAGALAHRRYARARQAPGQAERAVDPAHRVDLLGGEAVAAQADHVHAAAEVHGGHREPREHIAHAAGMAAEHGARTHPYELVQAGVARHEHAVGKLDVARQQRAAADDAPVADLAIVPSVRAAHPVGVVAHARGLVGLAAVDGHALAEGVVAADLEPRPGLVPREADVLRREAEAAAREHDVAIAHRERARQVHASDQSVAGTKPDAAADRAVRADLAALADRDVALDDCAWMDHGRPDCSRRILHRHGTRHPGFGPHRLRRSARRAARAA